MADTQLAEHVSITITSDSVGIARDGFGTPMILSYGATFTNRTRSYSSTLEVADDFDVDSPEYLAARAAFSQSPHPQTVVIGRGELPPTIAYTMSLVGNVSSAGHTYSLGVRGQGVTATDIAVTVPLTDVTVDSVANNSNTFTATAHGMTTGDGPYRLATTGGLPFDVAVDVNYWIIAPTADTFKLASSHANAIALTAIDITTDGTGVQTVLRTANDVTVARLVDALNAVVGKNFTAAQVTGSGDTDSWTVTATSAGDWFSISSAPLDVKCAMTHADPGVATDLDAIANAPSDWYALLTNYNSKAYVQSAAAWIEALSKIYVVDLPESDAVNTVLAGATDCIAALHTSAYKRTMAAYHSDPYQMFSAAWQGLVLPLDPGSETWKYKTPAGVAAVTLTTTQRANLRARKGNSLTTIAGRNSTWEGTTADGDFLDVRRGLDWIEDDMTKSVFEVLAANPKVPFTDRGIALIDNAVEGSLRRALRMGIIDSDFVVTVPRAADVAVVDRALRRLPDVKWSARLQGAVHSVVIIGVVSV